MPPRMIRDGLIDSERFNQLDYDEQVFYTRLLLSVDDAGRFDGRPAVLKAKLFPLGFKVYTDPVQRGLLAVQKHNLAIVYQVDGLPYIQILRWRRAGSSTYSKWPGPDGSFDIRYVTLVTRDGKTLFVDTSLISAHVVGPNERLTPEQVRDAVDPMPRGYGPPAQGVYVKKRSFHGDGDGDGDGDVYPPTPHRGDERAVAALPLDPETYAKHPDLRTLHGCIYLRGITLEMFLRCKGRRHPMMDFHAACRKAVEKAEIDGGVPKPGGFLDWQFSMFEQEHRTAILAKETERKRRDSELSAMVNFIVEMKTDGTSAALAALDRQRAAFGRLWGVEFVAEAERMAAEKEPVAAVGVGTTKGD